LYIFQGVDAESRWIDGTWLADDHFDYSSSIINKNYIECDQGHKESSYWAHLSRDKKTLLEIFLPIPKKCTVNANTYFRVKYHPEIIANIYAHSNSCRPQYLRDKATIKY
jgi:hypothetical protein